MLLGRGEILDIIDEKLEQLHAHPHWTTALEAKVQVLEQVKAEIKKREEG